MGASEQSDAFALLPDPGSARTVEDLVARLRSLKVWAGDPSYETIKNRVNAAWTAAGRPAGELTRKTTVVDCFRADRRRLNTDLVLAVVTALHPDDGYVAQWRQALRVIGGETAAAAQVRAQDTLPADLAEFTGRDSELDLLRRLLRQSTVDGGAVVISAIEGMAGVGKTQLAVHAGHLLAAEEPFERVLFVDLRGFHPDPGQPPADPAAVLDSFLRLLGVPGQQVPHGLAARAALYRRRLSGTRALVVLDNAATEDQVQPLLPDTPGCLTLVTSRRRLTGLRPATHLAVDVFTPDEALEFLKRAAPDIATGEDPDALARVTRRCGYLPLALGLIAGHMRATPDWTLTDHADRLDERHHTHRLDTGVELALDLSYQHLPAERRRLFRLLALHPGGDVDPYAAAALTGADLDTARGHLEQLSAEHLLRQTTPGRFAFHDLVRGYATARASDEDRPAARRAALTRLLDYYLHTAHTAARLLNPARDPITVPLTSPHPGVTSEHLRDHEQALAWFTVEHPVLLAAIDCATAAGFDTHAWQLAWTLKAALDRRGDWHDQAATQRTALDAARRLNHPSAQAYSHRMLGLAYTRLDRFDEAHTQLRHALNLYGQAGDPAGQVHTHHILGGLWERRGHDAEALHHARQALALYTAAGHRVGLADALNGIGWFHARLGEYHQALAACQQALTEFQALGHRRGEASIWDSLGYIHRHLGHHTQAIVCYQQARRLYRDVGDRYWEADALTRLGDTHHAAGDPDAAHHAYQQALTILDDIDHPDADQVRTKIHALAPAG